MELLENLLVVLPYVGIRRLGKVRMPFSPVELLLYDGERHEAVLLQVEDGLEPVDVLLRVQAVSRGRARRVEQPLVLEVPDL